MTQSQRQIQFIFLNSRPSNNDISSKKKLEMQIESNSFLLMANSANIFPAFGKLAIWAKYVASDNC